MISRDGSSCEVQNTFPPLQSYLAWRKQSCRLQFFNSIQFNLIQFPFDSLILYQVNMKGDWKRSLALSDDLTLLKRKAWFEMSGAHENLQPATALWFGYHQFVAQTAQHQFISYLRLAVFDVGSKHSSRDRIRCEKYFPSGSTNRAMVCAYKRTPKLQMCNSNNFDISSRNFSMPGRNLVWYQILPRPCHSWKWYTSCNKDVMVTMMLTYNLETKLVECLWVLFQWVLIHLRTPAYKSSIWNNWSLDMDMM